jgi:glycosyltransferase involved in cell wall biosynthesis
VISTDVGGVSDTMTNGETGLLIPAGNVDTLTEALSRLSEDESLRIRMGARGSSLADARFGVSRLVDDMRSYYNSLL